MAKTVFGILFVLQAFGGAMAAGEPNQAAAPPALTIEQTVARIQEAGRKLTSYQAEVIYEVNQPELETCMVKEGSMTYRREPKESQLRVDFLTLKQDDLEPVRAREVFIFDGIWLTHISYDAKSITQRQMTPEDQPADAFELASQSMPIIGFTDMEELTRHFDLALLELKATPARVGLSLAVKPGSDYSKDYTHLTFEVDRATWLPAKVVAVAPVGDIHTIIFNTPKLDLPIDKSYFKVKTPQGFSKPEIIPLQKQ